MENKKIGGILVIIAIVLLLIFIFVIRALNQEAQNMGCFQQQGCKEIETSLSIVHFAFGVFGFLFALGFFLIFFSKGEQAIVERLEADTNKKLAESKFAILSKGLDEFERKVLGVVKDEEGITQNTLQLRLAMSKAKVSQVLGSLEKKGLISREKKGKTLAVHSTEKWG